ncbi:MAG: hypothetical protein M9961_14390 [Ilumatobacteraceae bacterium]|nr:hypothetical protein [Ilumatobacteraceae bacterium]
MAKQRAELVEVPGLAWDGGAPMPVLIATDCRTAFACYLPTDDDRVVVAEVERCSSVRFGFPNDEVVHGHPCGLDLMHYGVHVIHESPWLAELRSIESVHSRAAEQPFADSRHYFLTFHDSSLEAIATGLRVLGTFASMAEAVAEMLRVIEPR